MFKVGHLLCVAMLFFAYFMESAFAEESVAPSCVRLLSINVDEHKILSDTQQHALLDQYMGRCIDGKLLKAMVSDVSSYYMDKGYITTRAFLKAQNISNGNIQVSVLKGYVSDIVDEKTQSSNIALRTAFAFQDGNVLNLRNIETSLEMMNRPSSSKASFSIKPGTEPGSSMIVVKDERSSPYHLKLGLGGRNNLNDKNLYLTGEFIFDNPLNLNDILKINYNGSRVQKSYQSNNGVEANYSFPIASYLFEIVGTDFTYRQGVRGINGIYLSSGTTQGLRARLSKILFRNQTNKLSAAFSVLHKNTKNYFSNQVIEVSSYRTTLAQADLTHTYIKPWGQLTTTYSYYQGMPWFGARTDGYISTETGTLAQARLQFKKHSLDTNLLYYFKDKSYQFSSNAHIQFTNDLLYDNDKLTVGSDYTVRGYSSFNLFGNNAWYIRNDLSKTWQPNLEASLLQSISLAAGLDYGEVRCESDNLSSCGSIAGTALSLSTHGKHLSSSFVWSKPLRKISTSFKKEDLVIFNMTWEF